MGGAVHAVVITLRTNDVERRVSMLYPRPVTLWNGWDVEEFAFLMAGCLGLDAQDAAMRVDEQSDGTTTVSVCDWATMRIRVACAHRLPLREAAIDTAIALFTERKRLIPTDSA